MASKYWIKLYHEILDDPKMGKLPDNLWRRAIELFLLAGDLNQDGELLDTEGIAWKLRITCNETLQNELQALQQCNIVTLLDNGNWLVIHFAKRQEAVDVNERVKRFRERQRKIAENPPKEDLTDDVTKRYTDKDKELDKESSPNGEGGNSKKPKKDKDSIPIPDAVKVYQTIARRLPDKALWPEIEVKVGATPECLDRWGKVITAYIGCGWNKLNLSGMLRFYEENRIPSTEPIKNGGSTNGTYSNGPKRNTDPDRIPSINIYAET